MPTPNVSVVDLVIQVEKKTLAEEVNEVDLNHLHCIALCIVARVLETQL